MEPISELDKAELKHEMRELYNDAGLDGSVQALYEMLVCASLLLEVIDEESNNDSL